MSQYRVEKNETVYAKSGETRYIHLYNFHNGYYSHGFELNVGGQIVQDGIL